MTSGSANRVDGECLDGRLVGKISKGGFELGTEAEFRRALVFFDELFDSTLVRAVPEGFCVALNEGVALACTCAEQFFRFWRDPRDAESLAEFRWLDIVAQSRQSTSEIMVEEVAQVGTRFEHGAGLERQAPATFLVVAGSRLREIGLASETGARSLHVCRGRAQAGFFPQIPATDNAGAARGCEDRARVARFPVERGAQGKPDPLGPL